MLDPKLQDGKKIPKWKPQTQRCQKLGVSPEHSTQIGLILNIVTSYVSSHYDVVYDDLVATVPSAENGSLLNPNRPFNKVAWARLIAGGIDFDDPDGDPNYPGDSVGVERHVDLHHRRRRLPSP